MSTSSYAALSRWNHSSRGAPLLRAVPGRTREDDLATLERNGAVAVEWLDQVVDGVPEHHDAALRTLRRLVDELHAMHACIARVRAHEASLATAFVPDGALARYLVDLLAWSEALCNALEDIATALRRDETVRTVFLVRTINESYARLDSRIGSIRATLGDGATARALDADLEELVWATSWLHVSLTKRFGE